MALTGQADAREVLRDRNQPKDNAVQVADANEPVQEVPDEVTFTEE